MVETSSPALGVAVEAPCWEATAGTWPEPSLHRLGLWAVDGQTASWALLSAMDCADCSSLTLDAIVVTDPILA
jgi:hypothetical protein